MQISLTHTLDARPRLPRYRLLVIGDFAPSTGDRYSAPIPCDRGEFQTLIERVAPELTLEVDGILAESDENGWLKLNFRSLKDFTPAGLIRTISQLSSIAALRRAIDEVVAGKRSTATLDAFLDDCKTLPALADLLGRCRTALGSVAAQAKRTTTSVAPGPTPKPDDGLDNLFEMVATPEQPVGAARDAISGVIASISGDRSTPALRAELRSISEQLTTLLEAQIRAILSHPRFVALEQAWRGLHWLLAGIGGDAPVDLQVLPRNAEATPDAINKAQPTDAVEPAPCFDLVLCDITIARNDTALMSELAVAAETAMTPVLVTLDEAAITTPDARPLARISDPAKLFDHPLYQRWNATRADSSMRWLAVCFNDYVLRAPYVASDRTAAGISQPEDVVTHGLWGHAGWLVARLIAEQQQRDDLPIPFTGRQSNEIQDLLLFSPSDAPSDATDHGPPRVLRHALSPDQSEQLAEVGIIALTCAAHRDSAWISAAPSFLRVRTQAQEALTRSARRDSSLTAQLLRARAVHCILSTLEDLSTAHEEERAGAAERCAQDLIAATGVGAHAEARVESDGIRLTMRLGERVLQGLQIELMIA